MHNTKNYSTDGGNELVIGGKLTVLDGATVTGLADAETLPAAAANVLGCVKVGAGLDVTAEGVLSLAAATANATGGVKPGTGLTVSEGAMAIVPAENVAASTATSVADLKTTVNAILAALKAAGFMAADANAGT